MNEHFNPETGDLHSQLNDMVKGFGSLPSTQQLITIYTELLKVNHNHQLEKEEFGLDENFIESQLEVHEYELKDSERLSIKEQVYALKSLGVFDYLKEEHGITIYEAAFLLHLISGKSIERYRNSIASKETAKLTNADKHKKKRVHRTLWSKGYHNEHGKKLLPKIDPIAFKEWVDSKGGTDESAVLNPDI
jgi:hypothetical protein